MTFTEFVHLPNPVLFYLKQKNYKELLNNNVFVKTDYFRNYPLQMLSKIKMKKACRKYRFWCKGSCTSKENMEVSLSRLEITSFLRKRFFFRTLRNDKLLKRTSKKLEKQI